MQEVPDS